MKSFVKDKVKLDNLLGILYLVARSLTERAHAKHSITVCPNGYTFANQLAFKEQGKSKDRLLRS